MNPFVDFPPTSPAPPVVARLDDGTFCIRQGAHALRLCPEQASAVVAELQRWLYPPWKSRDLGSV